MPIGAAAAAGLAGALGPPVLNAASDMWANHQNRKFSREMYNLQKNDSIRFWEMQNRYNSPEAQMQRFSSAGLNPNLIYGNSGDNSAGNIPTPDVQPANIRAPHFDKIDVLAPLLAQADLKIKQAQASNLNEQTEVIRQDAALRRFQALNSGFDFDFKSEFRDVSADHLRESVRQKRVASDLAINSDARAAIMNAQSVSESAERIATMIAQRPGFVLQQGQTRAETSRILENIRQMQIDGRLKEFEEKLNRSNMTKSDPLWSRIILDFLMGSVPNFSSPKDPSGLKGFGKY